MKGLLLIALGLVAAAYMMPAHARIQAHCVTYDVSCSPDFPCGAPSPRQYCWLDWYPDAPPFYDPPTFPQPPGVPPVPNATLCQQTLDNWPSECSKKNRPVVQPSDGCTIVFDSFFGTVDFGNACAAHDQCYGTLGNSKSSCDGALGDDMTASCEMYFFHKIHFEMYYGGGDPTVVAAMFLANAACQGQAGAYAGGLSLVPDWIYYAPAQKVAKCQKAHDDRVAYCGY